MEVTLISALARDRTIGTKSGGLPWDLPKDKAHFRSYTAHKPILLGRHTFEEMEGWFTSQHPIYVLTSRTNYHAHTTAIVLPSIHEAISLTKAQNHPELLIAGGASAFESALPHATKLVLTWVEAEFATLSSPLRFPEFEPKAWPVSLTENWPADSENRYPMTLEIRKKLPSVSR